jgi:FMN phosphatase YigB (HAD superfamily)
MAQEVADLGKQNEFGMIDNETHLHKMAEVIGIDPEELRRALGVRVPNEEMFSFITEQLKPKYKIGLMSNANFNVLEELFTEEQAVLFDASVMSYESRLIKPDVRMFDLMASRLGVERQECVFIDDQERYANAAEDIGMCGICYQSPEQFKSELLAILTR